VYDFENHLVQQGGISVVYDGDGNRVKKTVAGVVTQYLVADANPTGYAQVMAEQDSGGNVQAFYVYGSELVSRQPSSAALTAYYVYDGHGSVRALTNTSGAVTDTYDYDAFGNLLHSTGTSTNNYLFAGEQYDPDLHLYYNRARYLNTSTGRFWSMDTFVGRSDDPLSLHKYLYAGADPINRRDPRGRDFIDSIVAVSISVTLFVSSVPHLLSEAFEEGGTAVGVLFNEIGQVAENYAAQVLTLVEDEIGEIEILQNQRIGGRVIDFVVRNAETAKLMFIEVKYGFPSNAAAMSRAVAQIQAASQAAEQGGGQVVLWTLRTLTPSQLQALESELEGTDVQILSGAETLGKVVLNYFQ